MLFFIMSYPYTVFLQHDLRIDGNGICKRFEGVLGFCVFLDWIDIDSRQNRLKT